MSAAISLRRILIVGMGASIAALDHFHPDIIVLNQADFESFPGRVF